MIRTIEIVGLPDKFDRKKIGNHLPPSIRVEKEHHFNSPGHIKLISDLKVTEEWKLEIY